MSKLSDKLQKYRKENNLSKSELARKLHVSPSYITILENGKRKNPSNSLLINISNTLDIPISDLITDNENKLNIEINDNDLNSLKHEDNFFLKPSEQDITLIYKKFIDLERKLLIELIENVNKIFCQSKYNTDDLIRNNDVNYRDLSTLIENIITARLDYYQRLEHEKNNIINKE